mmetsp:Transcript_122528/g.261476  ORF Transcript_122528/g.261476 Transcript_122528/m.261476 type:complete len:288 (+) Transcript_122528:782-1645(+)
MPAMSATRPIRSGRSPWGTAHSCTLHGRRPLYPRLRVCPWQGPLLAAPVSKRTPCRRAEARQLKALGRSAPCNRRPWCAATLQAASCPPWAATTVALGTPTASCTLVSLATAAHSARWTGSLRAEALMRSVPRRRTTASGDLQRWPQLSQHGRWPLAAPKAVAATALQSLGTGAKDHQARRPSLPVAAVPPQRRASRRHRVPARRQHVQPRQGRAAASGESGWVAALGAAAAAVAASPSTLAWARRGRCWSQVRPRGALGRHGGRTPHRLQHEASEGTWLRDTLGDL